MNNEKLKDLTYSYWDERWLLEKYIAKLLPEEIKYLRQTNRIKTSDTESLVQLVGFSWEPLLISVCAYKPQKLILILNKFYGDQEGAARGDKFKEYINKLKSINLIDVMPEIIPQPWETINDTPEDVFKFLKKKVLPQINEGKQVIIDITGAKKSMVSGAYLFASYTNCPVSYLDYDEYSEKYGKPYGYTCKINELKNPMELFKLREWNRVEELYERYAFGSALKLIDEIKENTKSLIESDENNAIELLKECLQFYEVWDNGDYKGAWQKYSELEKKIIPNITCPSAVKDLGEIWYSKDDLKNSISSLEGLSDITESIYLKKGEILIYAKDELKKIERLIEYNEDFRSALLRAAGLNDFLLKARVIRLWMEGEFVIEINNESLTRVGFKDKQLEIDKKLLQFAGAPQIIKCLRWEPSKSDYALNLYGLDKEAKGHRSENGLVLDKFWEKIKFQNLSLPDGVFNLRNKAIHFCLSVPKEIAEVALELAEKNLEDFKNKWIQGNAINGIYETMDWHELCNACGIKFLPKLRRE